MNRFFLGASLGALLVLVGNPMDLVQVLGERLERPEIIEKECVMLHYHDVAKEITKTITEGRAEAMMRAGYRASYLAGYYQAKKGYSKNMVKYIKNDATNMLRFLKLKTSNPVNRWKTNAIYEMMSELTNNTKTNEFFLQVSK